MYAVYMLPPSRNQVTQLPNARPPQITTANLAARYRDPLSVGVGALLALWSVTALALTVGRGLVQRIPARLVRRFTGVVLALLAVLTVVEAIRA